MKTVPSLRSLSEMQPGVYLAYGGSHGNHFAVPLRNNGEPGSQAVLFGPNNVFRLGRFVLAESFLLSDAAFIPSGLLDLASGLGALTEGCLAISATGVAISYRDGWDDVCWVDVGTGEEADARAHRHYFRSWALTAEGSKDLPKSVFDRSAP